MRGRKDKIPGLRYTEMGYQEDRQWRPRGYNKGRAGSRYYKRQARRTRRRFSKELEKA